MTSVTLPEARQDPVAQLYEKIHGLVFPKDMEGSAWELALYTLVCAKEPNSPMQRLVNAMPRGRKVLDKLDVMNIMANLDYFPRQTISALGMLDPRLLPCLWIDPRRPHAPYVLLKSTEDGWYAFDTIKADYVTLTRKSISFRREGEVWLFEIFDEHKTATSKFIRDATGLSWFSSLLSRFRSTFMQVFVVGFMLNIFALASPLFIMMVYDRVLTSKSHETLMMFTIGMLAALTCEWWLRQLRSTALSWFTARLDNIIGNRIFAHIIHLPPTHIERAGVTGQVARIRTFESARDFFSGPVFMSVIELPYILVTLFIIYLIAGNLAFVVMAMGGLYLGLFFIMRQQFKVAIRTSAKVSSMRQQLLMETFEKLPALRTSGLLELWYRKFHDLSGRDLASHRKLQWLTAITETAAHFLSILTMIALIGFGVNFIWAGAMATSGLIASMLLVWRVLTPLYSLCLSIARLEQTRTSLEQVETIMNLDSEESQRGLSVLPNIKGFITFENVNFRYKDLGERVLNNASFSIKAGEFLAIAGLNGTGKSTILKLLQGMYQPNSGLITIDGYDSRQIDPRSLRQHMAYIPQVPEFFTGSILDNLRMSQPLASEDDIWQALAMASAADDVRALPHQLDTPIEASIHRSLPPSLAIKLSLARAYLQLANVILIDEIPNAFQAGVVGDALKQYIQELRGKRTVIFASYRRDYLELADYILALRPQQSPVFGIKEDILPQWPEVLKP
jgi:ABC-type bacteriocin/lantibiotic exporter with double-glycine peptidase domain